MTQHSPTTHRWLNRSDCSLVCARHETIDHKFRMPGLPWYMKHVLKGWRAFTHGRARSGGLRKGQWREVWPFSCGTRTTEAADGPRQTWCARSLRCWTPTGTTLYARAVCAQFRIPRCRNASEDHSLAWQNARVRAFLCLHKSFANFGHCVYRARRGQAQLHHTKLSAPCARQFSVSMPCTIEPIAAICRCFDVLEDERFSLGESRVGVRMFLRLRNAYVLARSTAVFCGENLQPQNVATYDSLR